MRRFSCLMLLALLAPAANAVPIRIDFTIARPVILGTAPASGSATGGGYFVFDDSLLALAAANGGELGNYSTALPTLDLSFDWLGVHFDDPFGTLGMLRVGAGGQLSGWSIDGLPASGCGFQCVQWGTTDFSVTASGGPFGGGGSALLTQTGANGVAIGSVSWTRAASVPEPGTLALFGLALAGMAFGRRRLAA